MVIFHSYVSLPDGILKQATTQPFKWMKLSMWLVNSDCSSPMLPHFLRICIQRNQRNPLPPLRTGTLWLGGWLGADEALQYLENPTWSDQRADPFWWLCLWEKLLEKHRVISLPGLILGHATNGELAISGWGQPPSEVEVIVVQRVQATQDWVQTVPLLMSG